MLPGISSTLNASVQWVLPIETAHITSNISNDFFTSNMSKNFFTSIFYQTTRTYTYNVTPWTQLSCTEVYTLNTSAIVASVGIVALLGLAALGYYREKNRN